MTLTDWYNYLIKKSTSSKSSDREKVPLRFVLFLYFLECVKYINVRNADGEIDALTRETESVAGIIAGDIATARQSEILTENQYNTLSLHLSYLNQFKKSSGEVSADEITKLKKVLLEIIGPTESYFSDKRNKKITEGLSAKPLQLQVEMLALYLKLHTQFNPPGNSSAPMDAKQQKAKQAKFADIPSETLKVLESLQLLSDNSQLTVQLQAAAQKPKPPGGPTPTSPSSSTGDKKQDSKEFKNGAATGSACASHTFNPNDPNGNAATGSAAASTSSYASRVFFTAASLAGKGVSAAAESANALLKAGSPSVHQQASNLFTAVAEAWKSTSPESAAGVPSAASSAFFPPASSGEGTGGTASASVSNCGAPDTKHSAAASATAKPTTTAANVTSTQQGSGATLKPR